MEERSEEGEPGSQAEAQVNSMEGGKRRFFYISLEENVNQKNLNTNRIFRRKEAECEVSSMDVL